MGPRPRAARAASTATSRTKPPRSWRRSSGGNSTFPPSLRQACTTRSWVAGEDLAGC